MSSDMISYCALQLFFQRLSEEAADADATVIAANVVAVALALLLLSLLVLLLLSGINVEVEASLSLFGFRLKIGDYALLLAMRKYLTWSKNILWKYWVKEVKRFAYWDNTAVNYYEHLLTIIICNDKLELQKHWLYIDEHRCFI